MTRFLSTYSKLAELAEAGGVDALAKKHGETRRNVEMTGSGSNPATSDTAIPTGTPSRADVLTELVASSTPVLTNVRFCIRPAEHPMAGDVPKSTRLEASLRHGTEQLERYALLYIAGTSIFAPHQYLGAFPALRQPQTAFGPYPLPVKGRGRGWGENADAALWIIPRPLAPPREALQKNENLTRFLSTYASSPSWRKPVGLMRSPKNMVKPAGTWK